MTPEIRRKALRMAAKTAFVMSIGTSAGIAGGCSGGATSGPAPSNVAVQPVEQPCPQYLDALEAVDMGDLPATDPLHGQLGYYGAFKDVAMRAAPHTQQCCKDELTTAGSSAKHRWACCSAIAKGEMPAEVRGSACTPWGPPVPPEMIG